MHRHACLVTQLFPTVCAPVDYSLPDCSVHGIFQARILEQVAVSSSRGSSLAGIKAESPRSPALAGGFFTTGKIYSPILLGKYIIDCLLRTRCCSRKALPSLLHPGHRTAASVKARLLVGRTPLVPLALYLLALCLRQWSVSLLLHPQGPEGRNHGL